MELYQSSSHQRNSYRWINGYASETINLLARMKQEIEK